MFHLTKLFSQFRCLPVPLLLTVSFLGLSNMPIKANPEERYQVSGDEAGKVTVVDADSGEVVNTFQIDEGGVIEETFVLDEGKTIAAAQNEQTIFWNLETGEEIGRVQGRMYNFFEVDKRIITYAEELVPIPQSEETEQDSDQPNLQSFWTLPTTFAYRYPELDSQCKMPIFFETESDYFRLSPDGRYLAISLVATSKPEGCRSF